MHTATDLTPRARRWLTAACLVGAFLGSMEVMVVSPVMPSITEELGQAGLTPWVVTTFMLAQVVAMPLFGRLADTWGRRDAWLLGVGLFALGNLVASLAPGMGALLVGRFLQGLGGGALIPIALILFGDLYEPIERTRLQALFSVVWGVSSLIGPGLGGGLTEAFGWRSIFWTPLPVAVGLVGLILALLPRRLGQRPPSANPGGPRQALREVATIYEHPIQRLIAGAGFLMGAGLLCVMAYLPIWLTMVESRDLVDAGFALVPFSVAWTGGSLLSSRLLRRVGLLRLLLVGETVALVGALSMVPSPGAVLPLLVLGVGFGVTVSCMTVISQEFAPSHLRGQSTSWAIFFRVIGQAALAPVLGLVAGIRPDLNNFSQVRDLEGGLRTVFASQCALYAAALVLSAVVIARQPRVPAAAR
jgi:MFS family permease